MTYQINLLPWRLQQRRHNQKTVVKHHIFLFLFVMGLCLLIHAYLRHIVQVQTLQYQQLINEKHKIVLAIQQVQNQNNTWETKVRNNEWIRKIAHKRDSMIVFLKVLQKMTSSNTASYRIERHKNRLDCIFGCQN